MHAASILPLAFTAALLAACSAESPQTSIEETGSSGARVAGIAGRNLTLQTSATPAVEVASAVELSRTAPETRVVQRPKVSPEPAHTKAPDPVPEASPVAESPLPAPTVAVAEMPAEPAPVEDVAADGGRELAPGKTVTIIPASSGPSSAPEEAPSWGPTGHGRSIMIGGGGGRCRPRGGVRGIGIAGRIPVGIPGRRLR